MNQLTTRNPQALELLKGSFQLVQLESFFDVGPSEPKSLRRLWASPEKAQLADIGEEKVIAQALMEKKGRKTNRWQTRYYILTLEFLAYKEVSIVLGVIYNIWFRK